MMNSVFTNTVRVICILMFCLSSEFAKTTAISDFIDNNDGTVTHKKTGLIWQRCYVGQTWTNRSTCAGKAVEYKWNEAIALKSDFAGKNDWRLPNFDELLSIVEKANEKSAINTAIFPSTSIDRYSNRYVWSSSPYANFSSFVWIVSFKYGDYSRSLTDDSHFVLLVRGKQWFSGFLIERNKQAIVAEKMKQEIDQELGKCMKIPKCSEDRMNNQDIK